MGHMEFRGKAFFNHLKMNLADDPDLQVKDWQVADYDNHSDKQLFAMLKELDICLDNKSLLLYFEECDSPEELTECLVAGNDDIYNQVYLIIFEFWKRYSEDTHSLSVLCDELDMLIYDYDRGILSKEERLQELLGELENILDENLDESDKPEALFALIKTYFSFDLTSFLYDYIALQIDEENPMYASELLDGFYRYIEDKRSFDFLKMRLIAETDMNEANIMLGYLQESLTEKPNLDLSLDILHYLLYMGSKEQFCAAVDQLLLEIQSKEDFLELLYIIADYFALKDLEDLENEVKRFTLAFKEKQTFTMDQNTSKYIRDLLDQ